MAGRNTLGMMCGIKGVGGWDTVRKDSRIYGKPWVGWVIKSRGGWNAFGSIEYMRDE